MADSRDEATTGGAPAATAWGRLVREGFVTLLNRTSSPAAEAATVVLAADGELTRLLDDLRSLFVEAQAGVVAVTGAELGRLLDGDGGQRLLDGDGRPPRLVIVERIDTVGGPRRQRSVSRFLDHLVARRVSSCLTVSRTALTAGFDQALESRLAAALVIHVPSRPVTAAATTCSVATIVRDTARRYAIAPVVLTGPGRSRSAVEVRNLAMYLARRLTGRSFGTIGRAFGGRDHTTVMRAVRAVEMRIATDASFATEVKTLLASPSGSGGHSRRRRSG